MKTDNKINKPDKDPLGLGWILAGMFFLFNPTMNIVDFLPDFVGLLMIVRGLQHMAVSTEHIREARRLFAWLALISALKLATCAALPFTSDNFKVLMAFLFSVAEALLFIPATNRMFDGFVYLGMRHGSDSVNGIRKKNGKLVSLTRIRVLTVIAFIVRAAGSVLPVTPVLTMYDMRGYVGSNTTDPTEFINIYYILSAIAVIAVGIPWLVKMLRYIGGIRRDLNFCMRLEENYVKEFLSDEGKVCSASMKSIMIFGIVGAVLGFDIYFDQMNFFPDALSALFFGISLVMLLKHCKKLLGIAGAICSVLWAGASVSVEVLEAKFASYNYTAASVAHRIGMAEKLYAPIETATLIETALMGATLLLFILSLKSAVKNHIPHLTRLNEELYNSPNKSTSTEKEVQRIMLPSYIALAVCVVSSALYAVVFPFFPAFWIIKGAISLLFAAVLARQSTGLRETIYLHLENRI